MKKQKWMMLCMLALPFISIIKASNSAASAGRQKTAIVLKAAPVNAPATLIEQIVFPHGI